MNTSHADSPVAVLWDFGGVILTSPFEAFRRYEREAGLPEDFIRGLNARNPDANAWAKMERSEVSLDEFVTLFESEAEAQGHKLDGWRVLQAISGDIRPQMVEALRRCRAAFIRYLPVIGRAGRFKFTLATECRPSPRAPRWRRQDRRL